MFLKANQKSNKLTKEKPLKGYFNREKPGQREKERERERDRMVESNGH